MTRRLLPSLVLLLSLVLVSCGPDDPSAASDANATPVVYTTFYPTTYFTRRVGGELVEVVCPVPDDADPIFWNPDDTAIEGYQQADLIVVNGARFEKWVLATSLPDARVVDTAKPFEKEFLTFQEAVEHSHGPGGKHAHEGVDGHTWLDPKLAGLQATAIATALKRRLPDHAQTIDANLRALLADLDGLHAAFESLTEGYAGEPLLASHPAYNYPAFRYGWTVRNLDLDPDEMPSNEQLAEIGKILETTPAQALLWEAPPRPEIAERLQNELGLSSVTFSPVEMLSAKAQADGEDYLSVMRANLTRLTPVLEGKRIFEGLLERIYEAIALESEVEIYEALAKSVEADVAPQIYGDLHAGLALGDEEGTPDTVSDIEVADTKVTLPADATGREFDIRARWRVSHVAGGAADAATRIDEYEGVFTLVEGQDGWRIAAMQILEQKRVDDD